MPRLRSRRFLALAVAVVVVVVGACSASDDLDLGGTTTDPTIVATGSSRGAAGAGDSYYPGLGNGGYDVDHYDLDLTWDPVTGVLDGVANIDVVATQDLSQFNLDLFGMTVTGVTVDGVSAGTARDGRELTVTPLDAIVADDSVTVTVTYTGVPETLTVGTDVFRLGWHADADGVYVASEPAGAATWFPGNDHPTDKATFRFRITVPDSLAAVANGVQTSVQSVGDTTTYVYDSTDEMATYLASVAIGDLVFAEGESSSSGVPVRNVAPRRLADAAAIDFARTGAMIDTFEAWFGPYPFVVYGHVVVDEALGYALENQTLSLFGADLITGRGTVDAIVAHELAHQWFGNSVSVSDWSDIWLNEGFATFAEWIWEEESGGRTIEESARSVHARADFGVAPGAPGPDELFQGTVYLRGGLALHALRETIGDDVFRAVLRAWASRHRDGDATTADLQALAEERSGVDLDALFEDWVYGVALPPLP